MALPPPPPGVTLDAPPPPPPGVTLDSMGPSMKDRIIGMADATANAAPTAGMMIGGALGTPGGPATAIAGAGIGGAGGSAYKRVYQYLTGRRDPNKDTALGNAGDIAKSGLAGMGGEVIGQQAGAVLKALQPGAAKVGAGVMKIAAGVPEKYGETALNDPNILSRAMSKPEMSAAYYDFEKSNNLQGLEAHLVSQNRATASSSELEGIVLGAANKVIKGHAVDPQELYLASQAASRLKLAAKYGEPQAQMAAASGAITQGKGIVDKALETAIPGYGKLRTDNFESNVGESLSHILPQNKGGTTNFIRPVLATNEVIGALATGHPGALAALPAMSPAAWGLGIRGANAASPAAKFLAKYGIAKTSQDMAEGQ